jgi:predicted N-acyltransferase
MPRSLVIVLAEREARPVAGALCLRGGDTLYGRYWGAVEQHPGLHFETCYYQGIEYCLREGLARFEPGAQGEHKLARGFLPSIVRSRHWIAEPEFRDALTAWCADEREAVLGYARSLRQSGPFRETPP